MEMERMVTGRSAFFSLALLASLAGASGCSRESAAPAPTAGRVGPDEIIEDLQMTESSAGARTAVVHARRASIYQYDGRTEIEGLDVDFYEAGGRKYSHLKSDRGTLNQNTNDMKAEGRVDIVTVEGVHVEAPVIQYWSATQKLVSDALVKVTDKNGSVITGVGFESDTKVTHYRVGKVNATLRPSDPGQVKDK